MSKYPQAELDKLQRLYDTSTLQAELTKLTEQLNHAHDGTASVDISKISADLAHTQTQFDLQKRILDDIADIHDTQLMIDDESEDADMIELAQKELSRLYDNLESAIDELNKLLIQRELYDPDDAGSVVMEIRAGAGGEEAAIFAGDLFRMYNNFALSQGWQFSIISVSNADSGGYKEVLAFIDGKGVYGTLKYESGVHRVQRIPQTESKGRIHTSTASVIFLPEAPKLEVEIKPEDLRIDTMRASGAGGQHVNKTTSAVRITHIPTGITAFSQESRVQQENRKKAMLILQAKLYEAQKAEKLSADSDKRKTLVKTGDRSEKIRTYNYPQSRVTDHRIKKSWHDLENIMNGNIRELVQEVHDGIEASIVADMRKS